MVRLTPSLVSDVAGPKAILDSQAAIRLHTLLDLRGPIPSFIEITEDVMLLMRAAYIPPNMRIVLAVFSK